SRLRRYSMENANVHNCQDRRSLWGVPETILCLFFGLSVLVLISPAAADWTGFRGPQHFGLSDERNLPQTWSDTDNIAWKTRLPGPGSSGPITSGTRIFLTCCTGYGTGKGEGKPEQLQRLLLALDRQTGKILWQQEVPAKQPENPYQGNMTNHSYASSTP